jgi:hypothetical protein
MPLRSIVPEVDHGVDETKGGDGVEETVGSDRDEETVGGDGVEETKGSDGDETACGGGPVPYSGPPSSPHPTPATAANGVWLVGCWLAGWRAQSCACACH